MHPDARPLAPELSAELWHQLQAQLQPPGQGPGPGLPWAAEAPRLPEAPKALDEGPRWRVEAWRLVEAREEGPERVVIWAQGPEAQAEGLWALGWGLRRLGDGAWAIAWEWLGREVEPWPWSWGLARHHALALHLEASPSPPPSWQALAWRRLHPPAEATPFHALPEARFSCHSSTSCCTPGFLNLVPWRAQVLLYALPWVSPEAPEAQAPGALVRPLEGLNLDLHPDSGQLVLKAAKARCRFLDAQDRCQIHSHLGWQPFPVCSSYPLEFVRHPEGVDVSALHSCPSARQGRGQALLDPERVPDLLERLALGGAATAPERLHLSPAHPVPWAAYRQVEAQLLATLQAPGGVAERLWRAHLILCAHEQGPEALAQESSLWPEALSSEARLATASAWRAAPEAASWWPPRPVAPPERRQAGLAWLWRTMPSLTGGLTPPAALLDAPGPEAQALGEAMRYLLHRKLPYALEQGLRTQLGAVALLGLQGLALEAAHAGRGLPEALWTSMMQRFTGAYVFQLMDADPQGAIALLARAGQPDFLPQLVAVPEELPPS